VSRFVLATILTTCALGQDEISPATFGTTVVIPSGLRGEIYNIRHNSGRLPELTRRKSAGVIYASALNVPPQDFMKGFPGVTDRNEWFAIDYSGRFWIEKPGEYRWGLTSDDGSKLYIDGELVIDNDGLHPPLAKFAQTTLTGGIHEMRVTYFQGPKYHVALVLEVAAAGEQLRVFSTDEFKPPPNPETWTFPDKPKQNSRSIPR
jgi:hypothetical protein